MHRWVVPILIAGLLAGCSDAPDDEPQEEETFQDFEAVTTETTGTIRGVVVDGTISPLEGALVTLLSTGQNTTTNANGAFQFADIEAGLYMVEVTKPYYQPMQTSVDLQAGQVTDSVRVILTLEPSSLPQAVTLSQKGYVGCSSRIGVSSFFRECDTFDPRILVRFDTELESPPDFMQSEMRWDPSQTLGNDMRMFVRAGNGPDATSNNYLGLIDGPSPLTCITNQDVGCGNRGPLSDDTWTGHVHIDGAAGCYDGCTTTPLGEAGVGLMIQQHYESFLTTFVNTVPYEGWTFIENGAYDPSS